MPEITVEAEHIYQVEIGNCFPQQVVKWLENQPAKKMLLLHQEALNTAAKQLQAACSKEISLLQVPDGEAAKTIAVAAQAWDTCALNNIGRADLILSLGGGAVTDLAGFVAATWLRGIKVAHIPTTLLAMVDAAVGGKTGINTGVGKNLVGAFHSPQQVFIDPQFLNTLPAAEFTAGLAEIVKCGFIADARILEILQTMPVPTPDSPQLLELITRAIAVKAQIVSADFKESGKREFLNYGHTLAHAMEMVSDYQVRHGEAVAIGMVFAVKLAQKLGYVSENWVTLHIDLLKKLGLPTSWCEYPADELYQVITRDKKVRDGQLRFVFTNDLEKENQPGETWVGAVDHRLVLETLEAGE